MTDGEYAFLSAMFKRGRDPEWVGPQAEAARYMRAFTRQGAA